MNAESRTNELRKLLARQAQSLKPARDWFIETKLGSFESVLEVGCGCGDVLHEFSKKHSCVGLDIDLESLKELRVDGVQGDGHFLPFNNDSFDLVYCHIALMWFREPAEVLREMARVARKWICCIAEYDYGARLDYPDEFQIIRDRLAEGIISDGGDPFVGRKLNEYFREAGLEAEIGAYSHVMKREELEGGFEDEWNFIEQFTAMDEQEIDEIRKREFASIREGTRFLFTPVFYAVSCKRSTDS